MQDMPSPRAQLLGLPSFKTQPPSSAYQKEVMSPRTSPSRPRPVGQPSAMTHQTPRQTMAPKGILRSSPSVNNDAHLDYLDVEVEAVEADDFSECGPLSSPSCKLYPHSSSGGSALVPSSAVRRVSFSGGASSVASKRISFSGEVPGSASSRGASFTGGMSGSSAPGRRSPTRRMSNLAMEVLPPLLDEVTQLGSPTPSRAPGRRSGLSGGLTKVVSGRIACDGDVDGGGGSGRISNSAGRATLMAARSRRTSSSGSLLKVALTAGVGGAPDSPMGSDGEGSSRTASLCDDGMLLWPVSAGDPADQLPMLSADSPKRGDRGDRSVDSRGTAKATRATGSCDGTGGFELSGGLIRSPMAANGGRRSGGSSGSIFSRVAPVSGGGAVADSSPRVSAGGSKSVSFPGGSKVTVAGPAAGGSQRPAPSSKLEDKKPTEPFLPGIIRKLTGTFSKNK